MHALSDPVQQVFALSGGRIATLDLPGPDVRVRSLSGACWGEASVPMTPAYWAAQTWMWALDEPEHFRLGLTLAEELLACMLGGYGIPAEVGLAAYDRLRCEMHANPTALTDQNRVVDMLSTPLVVRGRPMRYRFARQKAGYVASAFAELPSVDTTLADRPLRDRLTLLRGVGPKTASWVVRNLRASDEVAILDVHVLRAGRILGIFDDRLSVERHYPILENAYLAFAQAIGARASILDSVIWMTMRRIHIPSTEGSRISSTGTPRSISRPVVLQS